MMKGLGDFIALIQVISLLLVPLSSAAFVVIPARGLATDQAKRILTCEAATLDLQSDTSQFGRGDQHLSAVLEEGDVVVYQTGSWTVDGVVVGDADPSWEYCQMETIQVVWTHNCEHGVLRGAALDFQPDIQEFQEQEPFEQVEFGPEQLVARIPVDWKDGVGKPLVDLNPAMWKTLG